MTRQEYKRQWRRQNKTRLQEKERLYRETHKEEQKTYQKRYSMINKKALLKRNKEWREVNKDKRKAQVSRYDEAWRFFLEFFGFTSCFRCGYDKCFAAIDFHHINPKEKKFAFADLLCQMPTEEKLAELEKVIPLCKNCHTELHEELKKVSNEI